MIFVPNSKRVWLGTLAKIVKNVEISDSHINYCQGVFGFAEYEYELKFRITIKLSPFHPFFLHIFIFNSLFFSSSVILDIQSTLWAIKMMKNTKDKCLDTANTIVNKKIYKKIQENKMCGIGINLL